LFSSEGTDLRGPLRAGADDNGLARVIAQVWRSRDDRYSERREASTVFIPKIEMSYIGG
jgi:cyclic pyranopterin phosphate synthase